ncbi:uncharacterized protein DS421_2g36050 [Arachis hypogaea]|nr:uncharacterized protein DS421_2g36050 [Arachis hypogaea]
MNGKIYRKHIRCKTTMNSSRLRCQGVYCSNQLSASCNNTFTLPNHGNNRTRDNVLDQSIKERLCNY